MRVLLMTPERKLVLRDISLGLSGVWVVFPFSTDSPLEFAVVDIGIAMLVTAAVAYARYRTEHREVPEWVAGARDHLRAHPGQSVLLTAALIIVLVLPLVTVQSAIDEFYRRGRPSASGLDPEAVHAGIAGLYLGFSIFEVEPPASRSERSE